MNKGLASVPSWLRWLLFAPSAVLALLITLLVYEVFYWFEQLLPFGWWLDHIFLNPAAFSTATAVFIIVGAEVAPPAGRKIVGLLLAVIPVIVAVMNIYIRIQGVQDPQWPLWHMTLDLIGLAIGVYLGVSYVLTQPQADALT